MTSTSRPKATVRFLKFNRDNPAVFLGLVDITREVKRLRGGQLSIKLCYEGLRFRSYMETTGDPYRLSNSFTAFYARLIMHRCEDLRGVFVLRPSVADDTATLVDARQITLWAEAQRDNGWLQEAAHDLDAAATGGRIGAG